MILNEFLSFFKRKKEDDRSKGYSGKRPKLAGIDPYRMHDDHDPKDIPVFKSSLDKKKELKEEERTKEFYQERRDKKIDRKHDRWYSPKDGRNAKRRLKSYHKVVSKIGTGEIKEDFSLKPVGHDKTARNKATPRFGTTASRLDFHKKNGTSFDDLKKRREERLARQGKK